MSAELTTEELELIADFATRGAEDLAEAMEDPSNGYDADSVKRLADVRALLERIGRFTAKCAECEAGGTCATRARFGTCTGRSRI